jgi:hypothetical protein
MFSTLAPSALIPAVGEHQRLRGHDDGEHEARQPRAEEYRRQRGAQQVPARAGRDGEVQHLRGEDERREHSEHRDPLVVEVPVGNPQRVADGGDRRYRRQRGDLPAQEAVGDVHRATFLPCGRNCK